jgi:adenylate cyclase
MGVEIERKFLVHTALWQALEKPAGEFYRQGYLLTDPHKTIRVRQTETKGFLTIKGLSVGAARPEFEYEIPAAEAAELLNRFAVSELSKRRYRIPFENKMWEVDEFLDTNAGLMVAEIELTSETEIFALPAWVDKEVTGDEKYYNSALAERPFKNWR